MPLVRNRVDTDGASPDLRALLGSLMKVVACYRHLASCVGGGTDSLQLRDELRQTREKAQKLAVAICQRLTSHLRDRSVPEERKKEFELLWVAFSSCLELLHMDMCKVFKMGDIFSLANAAPLVKTGLRGGGSGVAARALSLPELREAQWPTLADGLEREERRSMEREIERLDQMIEDMEMKVNVLRWAVEPRRRQQAEPLSSVDSVDSVDSAVDEQPGHRPLPQPNHIFVFLLLLVVVVLGAAALSVCIVFFS
ncbi:regulator of G-protein signaling 9-binding protein [Brachionichthys hirsutus]|uniref:regulator of G-protein signaling 9-binding protein n=1 Tax=Brachionichthys hirsutus TaxID=412623 RepID=UPI003604BF57